MIAAATDLYDAVVIGAGPAGGIAALGLARAGQRVLLVDKQRFPRAKVCGCCLNASALAVLREAGLGERLDTLAPPLVDCLVMRSGRRGRPPAPARGGVAQPTGTGRHAGRRGRGGGGGFSRRRGGPGGTSRGGSPLAPRDPRWRHGPHAIRGGGRRTGRHRAARLGGVERDRATRRAGGPGRPPAGISPVGQNVARPSHHHAVRPPGLPGSGSAGRRGHRSGRGGRSHRPQGLRRRRPAGPGHRRRRGRGLRRRRRVGLAHHPPADPVAGETGGPRALCRG